jgi:hypothetical protein
VDEFNKEHANFLKDHYISLNPDKEVPFVMNYITYKRGTDILEESQQFKLCIDLLDEGYYFNISDNGDYSKIRFTNRGKDIIWSDIKDDFSPFLELLREKYDIDNRETEEVLIWGRPEKKSDGNHYYFSIDELLNDEMENCGYPTFRPDLIRTIEIDVLNLEK